MNMISIPTDNFNDYCINKLKKYNLENNYKIEFEYDDKLVKVTFIKNGLRVFNGNNVLILNIYRDDEILFVNNRCKELRINEILFDWRNKCFKLPEISSIKIKNYSERKFELIRIINKFSSEFLQDNNITKYNITVEGKGERFLVLKIKEIDLTDIWIKYIKYINSNNSSYLIDLSWDKTNDEIFESVKKFIKKTFLEINLGENDKINLDIEMPPIYNIHF